MEGLGDQAVGDERAVVPGGIDEVDAELDGAAEHGAGARRIARLAPHAGAGELHRAEAEPAHLAIAEPDPVTHASTSTTTAVAVAASTSALSR